jgi:hypothetical protein
MPTLSHSFQQQVQGVLHAPSWVKAPVAIEKPLLLEAQAGLIASIELLQSSVHSIAHVCPASSLQWALGSPIYTGEGVLLCEVVPAQHLKARVWCKRGWEPNRPAQSCLPLRGQHRQIPDLSLQLFYFAVRPFQLQSTEAFVKPIHEGALRNRVHSKGIQERQAPLLLRVPILG